MAGSYLNKKVGKYLEELSAKSMVPGGGSAAALTAALGAGLNLMVINYSIKKGAGETENKEFIVLKGEQKESIRKLSRAVDEDCVVFKDLMGAIKKKKGLEQKYKHAAMVPMSVCRECCESMEVAAFLLGGNKNLITDVGSAACLLRAGFFSAALNVFVNLKYIKDEGFVRAAEEEIESMSKKIESLESEITKHVSEKIRQG
jgi:formiminotetrahydrofolate cyclodeaminase